MAPHNLTRNCKPWAGVAGVPDDPELSGMVDQHALGRLQQGLLDFSGLESKTSCDDMSASTFNPGCAMDPGPWVPSHTSDDSVGMFGAAGHLRLEEGPRDLGLSASKMRWTSVVPSALLLSWTC